MSDAAQGEPPKHEVFTTPLPVAPSFEMWKTPSNYANYANGKELPAQIKVWRVQNTGKGYGGVVARPNGFEDSPDAEILTPGYNEGKKSGAVGVGRHGNFLQWGFAAPPSQMTDAGKAFFINCICYIRKFEGKAPLLRRGSGSRLDVLDAACLLNTIKDPKFHARYHPAELLDKFKNDPDGLLKYYQDNLELIYRDKLFLIDADLKALGIQSNRQLATLEKLIELLDDPQHGQTSRKLLARYTKESLQTPQQWRDWLARNKGRIYFSDIGGFKFLVVPEGYLSGGNP
jgi:hypothetical protein